MSEGVGVHEVSKASEVSGAAPASLESFAGLMVPGGSGRHQLSIPRRTDNVHVSNEMRVIVDQDRRSVRSFSKEVKWVASNVLARRFGPAKAPPIPLF